MDIGNGFSIEDFLAYFFPGVTASFGIYILIQITSVSNSLHSLSADITTAIIFFVLSYILGVIVFSFAEILFSKTKSHKDVIPLNDEFKKITIVTFKDVFKVPKDTKIE